MNMQNYSTYLLLDTLLMPKIANAPWMKDRRCRGWMERVYDRTAAAVSPVLVDIDAAWHSNRIPEMMDFVAAHNPKFHVSFIDTELSLGQMASHLRQLIYFVNEEGEEFTLRFADGAVLQALSKVLAPDQWKSFHGPIMNWRVHNRANQLALLPMPIVEKAAPLPLLLNAAQMDQLREEMAIYQLLASVRRNRSVEQKKIAFVKEYEWVSAARKIWLGSGHHDNATLWIFMMGVMDTNGVLLRVPGISRILSDPDLNQVRIGIKKAISLCVSNT